MASSLTKLGKGSSLTKPGKSNDSTIGGNGVKGKHNGNATGAEISFSREDVRYMLGDIKFDMAIGIVIMLNAITIGIEQSLFINNQSTLVIRVIETVFLVIYVLELCLRFYGKGRACMKDNWIKLDMALVLLGLVTWVLENGVGNAPEEMGALMLLRMARLMRLAKTARMLANVPECKMLVRGLLGSSSIIMYTLLLLLVVVYCFSVLGVELITKHSLSMGDNPDPVFRNHVDEFYGSVLGTMLTLLRFATMDHISEVYTPLVEKEPWLALYFLVLLFIVTIMIMNLVSSVIFTSMLDANQKEVDGNLHDQERDWASLISDLKSMFNRIDTRGKGKLTLDDFLEVDKGDQETLCQALGVTHAAEIFRMLDTEKRGQVSINEFFDRILDKVLASGDADLKRMERQIETMHWRLKETFSTQNGLSVQVKSIQEQLREILSRIKVNSDPAPEPLTGKRPSVGNGSETKERSPDTKKNALEERLRASRLRQAAVDSAVLQPRSSAGASDTILQTWEEDISTKLKAILDDGMRFALDSLRNVDNHATGSVLSAGSVRSIRDRSPSEVSGPASRESSAEPKRGGRPFFGSFAEGDPQAPPLPGKRGHVRSGRLASVSSVDEAPPKSDAPAPAGS